MTSEEAERYKNEANECLKKSEFDQAVKLYNKAIALDNNNPIYYSNRSAAWSAQSKFDNALSDAEKCLAIDKKFVKGYSRKGLALYKLGRKNEAVDCYRQGLVVDPTNAALQQALTAVTSAGGGVGKAKGKQGPLMQMFEKLRASGAEKTKSKSKSSSEEELSVFEKSNILAVDLPCHGRSTCWLPSGEDWEEMAQKIVAAEEKTLNPDGYGMPGARVLVLLPLPDDKRPVYTVERNVTDLILQEVINVPTLLLTAEGNKLNPKSIKATTTIAENTKWSLQKNSDWLKKVTKFLDLLAEQRLLEEQGGGVDAGVEGSAGAAGGGPSSTSRSSSGSTGGGSAEEGLSGTEGTEGAGGDGKAKDEEF
eukprot:g949.t1